MEPQQDNDLMRQLAERYWKHLQVLAEQDPTCTRLTRVLEEDRAIQRMDLHALQAFCARLGAKYGMANGRDT